MIENIQEIDSLIRKSIEEKNIMGASYSFISEDEICNHYVGYQGENKDKIPLRPDMMYDLASLTKVVGTTTRVFQLISDGTVSLSDKIEKFVPDLAYPQITIQQLLLHNSGLPADIENNHDMNKTELIEAIKNTVLINKPGETVVYSDLGYILLGWLIEKIDGNIADSVRENVFKPLGMNNSMYVPKDFDKSQYVPTEYQSDRGGMIRGTVHDSKAFKLDGVSGHAGLFSTLNDLNKFVEMYLNDGKYNNVQIIDPKIINSLSKYYQYGRTLGWKKWNPNEMFLWHTGFTGTSIALNLENHSGFVCLTNRVYPDRSNANWINTRRLAIGLFYNLPEEIK